MAAKVEMTDEEKQALLKFLRIRCRRCTHCDEDWSWSGSWKRGVNITASYQGRTIPVRRSVWNATHEKPAAAGKMITTKCLNLACMNPDLLVARTKGEIVSRTAAQGKLHTPASVAKIAATRRMKVNAVSQDDVLKIRLDTRPAPAVAKDYNISESYVRAIRCLKVRKDYGGSSPFSGLFTGLTSATGGDRRSA